MERKQLNKAVRKFKQTLNEEELDVLGEKTGFCQRSVIARMQTSDYAALTG